MEGYYGMVSSTKVSDACLSPCCAREISSSVLVIGGAAASGAYVP